MYIILMQTGVIKLYDLTQEKHELREVKKLPYVSSVCCGAHLVFRSLAS